MLHNETGSDINSNNQGTSNRDWRELRREWRSERREARYRNPLYGLSGGLILIFLGAIFLLRQFGLLSGNTWWGYVPLGIGVALIISTLVYRGQQEYHYRGYGRLIAGAVLILVGFINIIGSSQWWPVILIGAGVAVLICVFFRREQIKGQ